MYEHKIELMANVKQKKMLIYKMNPNCVLKVQKNIDRLRFMHPIEIT